MALTYASAIVWNAEIADDALWAKLRQHFSNPELVELGFFIALTLGQQRWIKTLGIGHREVLADTSTGLAPTAAAGGGPYSPATRTRSASTTITPGAPSSGRT